MGVGMGARASICRQHRKDDLPPSPRVQQPGRLHAMAKNAGAVRRGGVGGAVGNGGWGGGGRGSGGELPTLVRTMAQLPASRADAIDPLSHGHGYDGTSRIT